MLKRMWLRKIRMPHQQYLGDHAADSDCGGRRGLLPLQRPGLRLPVAAQGPAHAQAQEHVQH